MTTEDITKTVQTTVIDDVHYAISEAADQADETFEEYFKTEVMARVRQTIGTEKILQGRFRGPQKSGSR